MRLFSRLLALLALFSTLANAQTIVKIPFTYTTNVTLANVLANGSAVTNGKLCATPADQYGNPINVTAPGWGLVLKNKPACASIVAGAIAGGLNVPDSQHTNLAAPIYYNFSVQLLTPAGQPNGAPIILTSVPNVTGTSFALDTYAPPVSVAAPLANVIGQGNGVPASCVGPSLWLAADGDSAAYTCRNGVYQSLATGPIGPRGQSGTAGQAGPPGDPGTVTASGTNGSFDVPRLLTGGDNCTSGNVAVFGSASATSIDCDGSIDSPSVTTSQTPTMNVAAYGAKCDGVFNSTTNTWTGDDDSASFQAVFTAIEAAIENGGLGRRSVLVPPGACLLKQNLSLMGDRSNTTTYGLTVEGAGEGVSTIVFLPPSSSTTRNYLFNNNSSWLQLAFKDISFEGDNLGAPSRTGHTLTSFMNSHASGNGGSQAYRYDRVGWKNFDRGLDLSGANNNSEFFFSHVDMSGYVNKFLYVDPSVGAGGDQFLNYFFDGVSFTVGDGSLLDMAWGGSINIHGLNGIRTDATASAPLIKVGDPSVYGHAYATQRLIIDGARVEQRYAVATVANGVTTYQAPDFIQSFWEGGTITCNSCDNSSNSFDTSTNQWITNEFTFSNSSGPIIQFSGGQNMGRTVFYTSSNAFQQAHSITYSGMGFPGHTSAADFAVFNAPVNAGGQPVIHFEHSLMTAPSTRPDFAMSEYNSDYGWQFCSACSLKTHSISIKNYAGQLPGEGSSVSIALPIGAVITGIRFVSPAGAVTDGNAAQYTVETAEATPTVLYILDTTNTTGSASNGFDVEVKTRFQVMTDAQRTIVIQNNNVNQQYNSAGSVVIDYIG